MALLDSTLCFWRTASKADHSNAEFLAELNRPISIVILVSEGTNGILTSEVLTTEDRGCMHHFFATSPSSCDRSHESIGMPLHSREAWMECICLDTSVLQRMLTVNVWGPIFLWTLNGNSCVKQPAEFDHSVGPFALRA